VGDVDIDKLRAFLTNEDGKVAELADLPVWWDRIPADAMAPDLPTYPERIVLIASYMNWSHTRPWAWAGLQRLLRVLRERREPIPELLTDWALNVASSTPWPRRGRGRPREDERDGRVLYALSLLRRDGLTKEKAIEKIACALPDVDYDGVRSIVRKMAKAAPFPSGKKTR
jgi:hypothetical protein